MSIKDLFDKGHSLKFLKDKSQDSMREDIESPRYLDAYNIKRNRFIPDVDFTTASNFARFGLAELYYENSIKRIYETYPYDGSLAEKTEWENDSTYLDLYIFENEYPRTNGHVVINGTTHTYTGSPASNTYSSSLPEYIYFKGGPHPDPNGDFKNEFSAGPSKKGTSKANIYHTGSQRANNLEIDMDKGVTVEFWMKKDGWASTDSSEIYEYIFNVVASGSTGSDYANFRVGLRGDQPTNMNFNIESGSGPTSISFNLDTGLDEIADSSWHHYAFTAKSQGGDTVCNLYVDGEHIKRDTDGDTINLVTGTMVAALGALAGPRGTSLSVAGRGWGNIVSASFDEFRYWKTVRTGQQIGRYYRAPVDGGTNTDNIKYDDISNKVDLGVYFKFNEGITGISTTDKTVLDYSGRISNGEFINYGSSARSTVSAIVEAGAASKEFKDPVLYATHPSVDSLLSSKKISGSAHDHENFASIYKSMPAWILDQDDAESGHLKHFCQIMASYFDDLYLQIEKVPRLKDINYPSDNDYEKPLPFADRLLAGRGYAAPELFADASLLEKYLDRAEKKLFEKKLYEVKNTIYQNIYNNLAYIQKTKGTSKSIRNFLRCFGVDEELIKLNIYASNDEYKLKDNFTNTAHKKKYLDFDDPETRLAATGRYAGAYSATAYQHKDSDDSNSISYIPASPDNMVTGSSLTLEAEVFFPKRTIANDDNYSLYPSTEVSLFGLNAVRASDDDYAYDEDNRINFNVIAYKPDQDKRNIQFKVVSTASANSITDIITPNTYTASYDNEKWNLAFRLRPTNEFAPIASGSLEPADSGYTYELYGVNYLSDVLKNEFTISGTMSTEDGHTFFTKPKRVFAGAFRNHYTSSVRRYSDVKISSVKFWFDDVSDEAIKGHARDASNYGALYPFRDRNPLLSSSVPQIKTLALNWAMDNVTGSDDDGRFLIKDFTSGSLSRRQGAGYGTLSSVTEYSYTARGDFFTSETAYQNQAVDIEFVQTAKQNLPEVVNSDDMTQILNKQDDVVFTRDTTYVQHTLSIEKSMYQIVSDEMLRMFSTITDFNNLIGEPVNRYRASYKQMSKLRDIFFEKVENAPDLEKFIEYYKWIDDAITAMIIQLVPASSNTSGLLRNMVESHVLERNKYWTKFPTLSMKPPPIQAPLQGIGTLPFSTHVTDQPAIAGDIDAISYSSKGYKFLQPPVPQSARPQNKGAAWWRARAERDLNEISSSAPGLNNLRNIILKTSQTIISASNEPTLKDSDGNKYASSFFKVRSVSPTAHYHVRKSHNYKAGSNPRVNKIHDFYKSVIKWGSDDDFIFIDLDDENKSRDIDDRIIPPELHKKLFVMKAYSMNSTNPDMDSTPQYDDFKSTLLLPFSIYSSSINSGYIGQFQASSINLNFTNMHDDKYGPHSEIPMQGPFAEKYVGGMQHRHIEVAQNPGAQMTRPEGWHLQAFLNSSTTEYLINEDFSEATTTPTANTKMMGPAAGSAVGDPGEEEYWRNGAGADNEWTFLEGPGAASPQTGPTQGFDAGGYAYCRVSPEKVGQTFGLVTPLIDLLDVADDDSVKLSFYYHMFGTNVGGLKVQACTNPNFITDVTDLDVGFYTGPSSAYSLSAVGTIFGSQQASSADGYRFAHYTFGSEHLGKRFYIRFLYTAGSLQHSDIAIDLVKVYKSTAGDGPEQNSFKLFDPSFDNHHRPRAVWTRQGYAKRPVNIRNIHMTGSTTGSGPTIAGNYLNKYEVINTVSPEANDPWFVKNADSLSRVDQETINLDVASITTRLGIDDGLGVPRSDRNFVDPAAEDPDSPLQLRRDGETSINFTLLDRTFLTGSATSTPPGIRNRTRINSKFSSPGGFEVMSRGFHDVEHETYSVYNAMPWRNSWVRRVYNSHLQAHMGRYGVSGHTQGVEATTYIKFTGVPSNGEVLTLTDALGNIVNFKVDTSSNVAADGRLHSDGISVNIPLSGVSSAAIAGAILRAVINSVTAYSNNLSLYIVSDAAPGETHDYQLLTQAHKTADGNTTVLNNFTNTTMPFGSFFSSGSGPTARIYGSEAPGVIRAIDYDITGDAAKHKYHRNNIERIEMGPATGSYYGSGSTGVTLSRANNTYIAVGDHNSYSFGNASVDTAFSFSAWINMTDATTFPIITKMGSSSPLEWWFLTAVDDSLSILINDNASGNYLAYATEDALTSYEGSWIHVAATIPAGSGTDRELKLYVNGAAQATTKSMVGTYVAMHAGSNPVLIGALVLSSGTNYANGFIDEVSIWNAELTAEDVSELYHGAAKDSLELIKAGPGDLSRHTKASNLVSWWHMGDAGDTLFGTTRLNASKDVKGLNDATYVNADYSTLVSGPGWSEGYTRVTGSHHDNAFVSHMIPRTDQQTRWITASII